MQLSRRHRNSPGIVILHIVIAYAFWQCGAMIIGFGQEGQQYCRTGGQFFMYHRVVKCFGVDTFSQTHAEDRRSVVCR